MLDSASPIAAVRGSKRAGAASSRLRSGRLLCSLAAALACVLLAPASALAFGRSFLGSLNTFSPIGSTVPANGDVNPYGIVTVPRSVGSLVRGDLLISNFNDEGNEQGTGTTLVQISPGGVQTLFAQINPGALPGPCPGGVGLTTALTVLPDGYVVVGSLPTSTGKAETAEAGCLLVLDPNGKVVQTIAGGQINGPWDMTAFSFAGRSTLFVTNVLNGTVKGGETPTDKGTVVRLVLDTSPGHAPRLLSEQVIATGFPERTDPNALVVGPTGDALASDGTLYVADTQESRIAAVPYALFRLWPIGHGGITVSQGGNLSGPLGMTLAPNGDILTANGGNGNIVETTQWGFQFPPKETAAGAGGLFGLTLNQNGPGVYFVNDLLNTLELLH